MKTLLKTGVLITIAASLSLCQMPTKPGEEAGAEDSVKVYPVRVISLGMDSVTRSLEYTANLAAYREIHYAPAQPGRINKINVEVGNRIRKGQVLVEMDKTQLLTAQTQLASAEDSYTRIKTLYDQGSIAEQQYEQAKTQYELALQNVEFLQENTVLKSPVNGVVTGRYFENGEMFSGAPNTQAGKAAIISLMQIDPLKAIVNISQSNYRYVKQGMGAEVSTDILPGQVFEGEVTRVYPIINPATRTFQTEVTIKNPDEILRPGMFTRIKMMVNEEEAVLVPSIAVLKQSGTNNRYVFVSQNGRARRINVEVGKRYNDQVEILSDEVKIGMELIVDGQARLIDGSQIVINN